MNTATGRINSQFFKFADYKKNDEIDYEGKPYPNRSAKPYIYNTNSGQEIFGWYGKFNEEEKTQMLIEIDQYLEFFKGK